MVHAVPDILAQIVDSKRTELAALSAKRAELERLAESSMPGRRDFLSAVSGSVPSVIAEIKKASPSRGVLAADFQPSRTATAYQTGGAAALSVLTDRRYFQGSLDDLAAARSAARLPVLRKDFTIDEIHVVEAAAHNADAILLIAAVLDEKRLRRLREFAAQYRLAALVEVHDETELALAIDSGARFIGVNNRDLRSFTVRLETSLDLAARMPTGTVTVSESGIRSRADIAKLHAAGYRAFLVGEHLMKADDPAAALRELTEGWTA